MDEWQAARQALSVAGVAGVEDLGRFVNNTEHFAPSQFDERAAMPVLLDILPTATDAKLVEAIAAVGDHLKAYFPHAEGVVDELSNEIDVSDSDE